MNGWGGKKQFLGTHKNNLATALEVFLLHLKGKGRLFPLATKGLHVKNPLCASVDINSASRQRILRNIHANINRRGSIAERLGTEPRLGVPISTLLERQQLKAEREI